MPKARAPEGVLIALREDMQGRRRLMGWWASAALGIGVLGLAAWAWLGSSALGQILRAIGVVIRVFGGAR